MHERMASWVALAGHQASTLRPVDKAHDTVVAQHERLGELTNRWPVLCAVATYSKQKLVLGRGEVVCFGLFFAPVEKAAQAGAQIQELPVLLVCQIIQNKYNISYCDIGIRWLAWTDGCQAWATPTALSRSASVDTRIAPSPVA